jgi:hypothetical protein
MTGAAGRDENERETDTFNDKQSQIAERKTGGGRGREIDETIYVD